MQTHSETLSMTQRERNSKIQEAVAREGRRLSGFIRKRVRDPEDAQDILQEVWYQLTAAVEPIEQIGAWLYQVARRKIIDRYRKPATLPLSSSGDAEEDADLHLGLPEMLAEGDPESELLRTMIREAVMDALDEIPAAQREVFLLHEVEGFTFEEIAAETGTPLGTLLSRKRYAVLHLRERLSALYESL